MNGSSALNAATDAGFAVGAGCLVAFLFAALVVAAVILWAPRIVKAAMGRMTRAVQSATESVTAAGRKPPPAPVAPESVPARPPGEHAAIERIRRRRAILLAIELPAAVRKFLEEEVEVAITGWAAAEQDLAAVPRIVAGSNSEVRRRLAEAISGLAATGPGPSGLGTEREIPETPEAAAGAGWTAALGEVLEILQQPSEDAAALWHLYRRAIDLLRALPVGDPRWEETPETHALLLAIRDVVASSSPPGFHGDAARERASSRYAEAAAQHIGTLRQVVEVMLRYVRMTTPGNVTLQAAKRGAIQMAEGALDTSRRFEATVMPFVRPTPPTEPSPPEPDGENAG